MPNSRYFGEPAFLVWKIITDVFSGFGDVINEINWANSMIKHVASDLPWIQSENKNVGYMIIYSVMHKAVGIAVFTAFNTDMLITLPVRVYHYHQHTRLLH